MPPWFDEEVAALERSRAHRRGEDGLVVFYGSSSFTLWADIDAHFPGYSVCNNGFGGATLVDCVEYFDRLVTPFRPRALIVYAGDNDLGDGRSPEHVLSTLDELIARKRAALGTTPMAFVSIKVSMARLHIMHGVAWTNVILERRLADEPDVRFVNITRRMIARGMGEFVRYYSSDPLHMNALGYQVLGKSLFEYLEGVEGEIGPLRAPGPQPRPRWMTPSAPEES